MAEMAKYNMLQKSELKITPIHLENANLDRIADCVAGIYGIDRDKVLVIDVRNQEVALDILDDHIDPHSFLAKEKELLSAIRLIPGVTLQPDTRILSDGMLGWIAFDATDREVDDSLRRAEEIAQEVGENIRRRVIVFPSGTELLNGEIEDTNTPMLLAALRQEGFEAEQGEILKDDRDCIIGAFVMAITKGFGTIITTGGVGAEDKDHSVEAVAAMDPAAAAPYIAKFAQGHGRHKKEGIRIGVGEVDGVRIITLPGPNDEVRLCIPAVLDSLKIGKSKEVLANTLADILRKRLKEKCSHFFQEHEWE